jgi:hypothetical protein
MNAFRILSPNILVLRGIKEKSIPYSKVFNHIEVAIMFDCKQDAVYNIRRYTFPHLEKLIILNNIQDYEHSFLKYEYYEQPKFHMYLPSIGTSIDNRRETTRSSEPMFHNPYYTMNATRFITDKECDHLKFVCDVNGTYYKFDGGV